MTKTTVIANSGPNTLEGSSGMKWAIASSSMLTLSTKRLRNTPVGVSTIVPRGTRAILAAICSRMVRSALNAILCDIIELRQVRTNRATWANAAANARSPARSSVRLPSMRPAASSATTRYGIIPHTSPMQARMSETPMRARSGRMK